MLPMQCISMQFFSGLLLISTIYFLHFGSFTHSLLLIFRGIKSNCHFLCTFSYAFQFSNSDKFLLTFFCMCHLPLICFALFFILQTADILCISLFCYAIQSSRRGPTLAIANLNAKHFYINVVVIFHKMKNFNLIFSTFYFPFLFLFNIFFVSWIVGWSPNI